VENGQVLWSFPPGVRLRETKVAKPLEECKGVGDEGLFVAIAGQAHQAGRDNDTGHH
jgi:hypothetical protein